MPTALKVLILSLVLLFLLPSQAKAAPLDANNFNYLINGQTTLEGAAGHTFICGMTGLSPLNRCAGYQTSDGRPIIESGNSSSDAGNNYAKIVVLDQLPSGGALGAAGGLMASMMDNPPTSSGYFLANMGRDFGLVSPAYAQASVTGSGEAVIAPIYSLWLVTRNLAYAAFIIIIIIVGFMIMFRQRINPQTVVSIQQAIPSIVIGLALVTISYFIASLVLDLTFYSTNLVGQIFIWAGNNAFGGAPEINRLVNNGNVFEMFRTSGLNGQALSTVFGGTFQQIMTTFGVGASVVPAVLGLIGGFLAFGVPGAVIGGVAGAGAPVIIPMLVIIVLLFALFIQMIRLVFSLLTAYIELLVLTVAAPFYILAGSIPGRGGTISYWFRGLVANALIFPAVLAAFLFAGVILGAPFTRTTSSFGTVYAQGAGNPNTPSLPLFGGLSPDFIKVLIAYGILLGSPKIPDMVKEALKYKGPGGIAGEAMTGVNAGLLAGNATRNLTTSGTRMAYGRGVFNGPLGWARDQKVFGQPMRWIPRPAPPRTNPPPQP